MHVFGKIIIIFLSPLLVSCASITHQMKEYIDPNIQSKPHTILQGEQVGVAVLGQAELTKTYSVDDRGNISMPLIGSVYAYDKTPVQLAEYITDLLAQKYLRNPSVTVEMVRYAPIWVTGAVRTSGQFTFTPGMTAEAAVVSAGGYLKEANKQTVKITRRDSGKIFEANVVLQTPLAAGDIVRVYGPINSSTSSANP